MLTPAQILDKTITISKQKANLKWWQMFLLGIFAGMFIALAATGATFGNIYGGKIAAVFFPVMLFVLSGFEHSVANMFYIPAGMLQGIFANAAIPAIDDYLFCNLLPVALGNLIGGAIIVASGYYLICHHRKQQQS